MRLWLSAEEEEKAPGWPASSAISALNSIPVVHGLWEITQSNDSGELHSLHHGLITTAQTLVPTLAVPPAYPEVKKLGEIW